MGGEKTVLPANVLLLGGGGPEKGGAKAVRGWEKRGRRAPTEKEKMFLIAGWGADPARRGGGSPPWEERGGKKRKGTGVASWDGFGKGRVRGKNRKGETHPIVRGQAKGKGIGRALREDVSRKGGERRATAGNSKISKRSPTKGLGPGQGGASDFKKKEEQESGAKESPQPTKQSFGRIRFRRKKRPLKQTHEQEWTREEKGKKRIFVLLIITKSSRNKRLSQVKTKFFTRKKGKNTKGGTALWGRKHETPTKAGR